ncbi:hypothetical protein KAI04_04870 [Candidatus Pacearchaeota archaeon]|nr:hypothetical protein [Candidatus Pacearchaeota archaeon]
MKPNKEILHQLQSPERMFLNIEEWLRVHYPNILNEYENTKSGLLIYE